MTARQGVAALLLLAAFTLAACASFTAPVSVSPTSVASPAILQVGAGTERLVAQPEARRAAQPALSARFQAILLTDHCVDRDIPAPAATDVTLTVLDRTYALPGDYVPPDLVPAADAGLEGASGEKLVREILIDDLSALRSAWTRAGMSIEIESGYRSPASQAATFNSWVARLGYAGGLLRSARPGHSEHQLGTAIDVISPGWSGRIGDWAAETEEGAWMSSHAWEYGFVMSYQAPATPDTCFGYEPWHYRWIGREPAADQRASDLPLRRFLERFATG